MFDKILFLDFDGTITEEDTLNGSLKRMIDPHIYEEKNRELLEGKYTLNEVLRMGFSLIPSAKMPDILDYVRSVPIRPGFEDLLISMKALDIPVVVISGGLKPYIEEKLAPYRDKILDVYSIEVDTSGEFISLLPEYEEGGELMQKTRIMQQYDYKTAICVGDSHTDVRMSLASDIVFARDLLAVLLVKQGVSFQKWEDFVAVRDGIEALF